MQVMQLSAALRFLGSRFRVRGMDVRALTWDERMTCVSLSWFFKTSTAASRRRTGCLLTGAGLQTAGCMYIDYSCAKAGYGGRIADVTFA